MTGAVVPYALQLALTAVLAVAGASKLLRLSATVAAFRQLRVIPSALVRPVVIAVTAAELIAAALLITDTALVATAAGLTAMFLMYALAAFIALRHGATGPCRCFGDDREPIGPPTIVRASALALIAAASAATARGQSDGRPLAAGGCAVLLYLAIRHVDAFALAWQFLREPPAAPVFTRRQSFRHVPLDTPLSLSRQRLSNLDLPSAREGEP